jgi:uncharacterized SAM-binding protein YcdF (DUF218 family)
LLDATSQSTFENAKNSLALLQTRMPRRILIVTSYYHTHRAYEVFAKIFKPANTEILICGSPDDINYENWWRDEESAEQIVLEWIKTAFYWWRGRI